MNLVTGLFVFQLPSLLTSNAGFLFFSLVAKGIFPSLQQFLLNMNDTQPITYPSIARLCTVTWQIAVAALSKLCIATQYRSAFV